MEPRVCPFRPVLLAIVLALGCGSTSPPDVSVVVGFFPPGTAPAGYHEAKAKVSRGPATIVIGGMPLEYDPVHDQYQASLPDLHEVDVSVTVEGLKLTGSLSRRARDVSCTITGPTELHWDFGAEARWGWDREWYPGSPGIGLIDASDVDGPLLWPENIPTTLIRPSYFMGPQGYPPDGGYQAFIGPVPAPDHPVNEVIVVADGIDIVGALTIDPPPSDPRTAPPTTFWGIANLCALSVPVSPATLVSISIEGPLHYQLVQGLAGTLHLLGHFSDGSRADVTERATWTSSDPSIISLGDSLDAQSHVWAEDVYTEARGTAQITGTFKGLSASATVVVN